MNLPNEIGNLPYKSRVIRISGTVWEIIKVNTRKEERPTEVIERLFGDLAERSNSK